MVLQHQPTRPWEQPSRNPWEVYSDDVEWFKDNPGEEFRVRNLIRGEMPDEVLVVYRNIIEESETPTTIVVTVKRPEDGDSIDDWYRVVQVVDLH